MPVFTELGEFGSSQTRPTRVTYPIQVSWGERTGPWFRGPLPPSPQYQSIVLILLPALADVRGPLAATGPDYVEILSRKGSRYEMLFVDDFNKGTSAEFRGAIAALIAVSTPQQ